ncbi:MAG: hypothetical protein KDB63_12710 [Nocardioidaceae bacterium]|nr:hypothetical protein [Nocardioidaceae bacterium]
MRRRGGALVLATVAAVLAVLFGSLSPAMADDDGTDESAEQALAAKYAPVLMLVQQKAACGPGEPFLPGDVDVMFDNPTVALRGPWKPQKDLVKIAPSVDDLSAGLPGYALDLPGDPLDPGCDYERWADDQGFGSIPTIYAHVATEKGVNNRIALQYYFFYAFNDYNNKHETDWERIQIEFAASSATTALQLGIDPDIAVYSQHYGAEKATWGDSKLQLEDETHPIVYVSAGSHANQFSPGVFMGNSAKTGFGCDTTVGDHNAIRPVVRTIPSDPAAALVEFPWTGYQGHWGEVGPKRFYEGPTGPNRKAGWTKPFSGFSKNARSVSIEMPGGDIAGSSTASVYCDVVGKGSDAFRAFVANPLTTLGILAAIVVVVVWLLRRTAWDTDPLPLMERRKVGQVITAAGGMIVRHPVTFIVGALPLAALLVATAVLQTIAVGTSLPGWVPGVVSFFAFIVDFVTIGAMTVGVERIGAGEPHGLWGLYAEGSRRMVRAIPAVVGGAVIGAVLVGTLILSPLALALLVFFYLLTPVVVLEGASWLRPLTRSTVLVWRILGTVVPLRLFSLLLLSSVGALLAALLFTVVPVSFVVLNAVPPLVIALVTPLNAVMAVYAYYAGRVADDERKAPEEPTAEELPAGV